MLFDGRVYVGAQPGMKDTIDFPSLGENVLT